MLDNCREWVYFPIEMPLDKDGNGPANIGDDAVSMTYEVWDVSLNTISTHNNMYDAINAAIQLNKELE